VVLAILTTILHFRRDELSVGLSLSIFLLAVVCITALLGPIAGLVNSLLAPFLVNWFLIAPFGTFRIADATHVAELIIFASVSLILSLYVSRASRRAEQALRAERRASVLAALSEATARESVDSVINLLYSALGLTSVGLTRAHDGRVDIIASAGSLTDAGSPPQIERRDLPDGHTLEVAGNRLTTDDLGLIQSFVAQLSVVLEQRSLREVALNAVALEKADELRTAILRAVGHDLRSPLASIKASVSSLLVDDIDWPEDVRTDFLHSIEQETDRLTDIVTNLLDLSRVQAGALRPGRDLIEVAEIIGRAAQCVPDGRAHIRIHTSDDIPEVIADGALLERVMFNLLDNAVKWTTLGTKVDVHVTHDGRDVSVVISDRGPGIAAADRHRVTQPFHRLDDSRPGGLGLGLAIADQLTALMDGRMLLSDTPGGGLTVLVTIPTRNGRI
jgi:two-component system, OmpR family, sensor histidine kinase KdpD